MKTLLRSLAVVTFLAVSIFILPYSSTLPSASDSTAASADTANSSLRPVTLASAFAFQALPTITAVKSATLFTDVDNDTRPDPGDTLQYSVVISNTGSVSATGLTFTDTIDLNTTLVPGSVATTPVAANDSFTASGNIQITISAPGVLANDFDADGVGPALTVSGPATSTQGGNVTLSANGALTYNPPPGFEGTDTFTYTLNDNEGNTDTATVTFTVSGMIWFINSAAACPCDGRLTNPFNAFVGAAPSFSATAADEAGDNIFLFSGNYTGGYTLLANQRLIGAGAGASLSAITGITPPAGSLTLPSTGGANPVIAAAANNITLATGNTIRGVMLNVTAAAVTALTGNIFGTLNVGETAVGGTAGRALDLTNGTLTGPTSSTAAFTSISSTNSSTTGISLSTVAGNMSSGSTSVTNPTGIGISVASSSAALNFNGTTSTQSGGVGVSLTTNTGTVTFAGLTITPDGNQRGLVATDNTNTITVTSGAITTSGAAAVEITRASSTTPLAITLTSVSANGGPNGIKLTNTSGSFTVTGNGGNCTEADQSCTGGLIQNTTGGDVDPITTQPSGAGISLRNATNISLTRIRIANHSNYGIHGATVTGFTLANSVVNGVNGTNVSSPFRDSSIRFDQLTGTVSITNSLITGGFQHNLLIDNQSGAANISVSGNTIKNTSAAVGDDGFQLEAELTANVIASITNNTFAAHGGDHFNLSLINNADVKLTFTGNALSGGHAVGLGQGIFILGAGYNGCFSYDISNNGTDAVPFTGNKQGGAIHVNKGSGTAIFVGKIENNVIGDPAVTGSGSSQAFGIIIGTRGAGGSHTTLINNNKVRQYFDRGIVLEAGQGNAALTATVTNNTVSNFADAINSLHGIHSDNGILAADNNQVILDIRNNLVANAGNEPAGGADIRVRAGSSADVFLAGATTVSDAATADTFITAQNPNATTVTVTQAGSGTYNNGPASPLPPPNLAACDSVIASALPSAIRASSISESDTEQTAIVATLRTARGEGAYDANLQKLQQGELGWILQAAIERWRQANISAEDLARLQSVTFEIADLRDSEITRSTSSSIQIDETAAGFGWFFDQTPFDDSEFTVGVPERELQSTEHSIAHGKVDLLTVVMRELAKEYLKGKKRVPKKLRPLIESTLSPSVRRLPDASKIGIIIPEPNHVEDSTPVGSGFTHSSEPTSSHSTVTPSSTLSPQSGENVTLGPVTLPPAESFTVTFRVTIDNPFPTGDCDVSNTASVFGSNFTTVNSNPVTTTVFIAPTITCPANITTNTDPGVCTATETFTTTTTGCPAPTVVCTPPSGTAFAIGTTTVTCTATNSEGSVNCSFTVTVTDNQAPTITCPANITQGNDNNLCSAVVNFTPTTNDNCPNPTVVCTPPSASTFPRGTTTVSCTVTDSAGLSANCSFTVTVNDTQPPTLTPCPANINTPAATGQCLTTVNYTAPTATDNCPGVGAVTCAPASGTAFPVGLTTVSCSVSDAASNPANCSFTVTVVDNQPPSITCPAPISVSTPAGCVTVNYTTPTPTDNCPAPTVLCLPASGTCFPVGTTTVTCTATDASANQTTCSFTVSVIPCTITCPANVSQPVDTGACSAAVTYSPPTIIGDCGTVTCAPPSGSTFAVGTTTVTCTTGVGPSCSFTVTVVDNVPPTASCPANILTNNTAGQCSAVVNFTANSNDNCTGSTVVCTPPTGSTFPVGTTTVSCTATDASGNTSTPCTFTVTVNDTQPPTVSCPAPITVTGGAGQCSAVVNFTASGTDNCPGTVTTQCTPASGSTFPVGTTSVSCTATDVSGNTSSPCTFTVTVTDSQPPAVMCPAPITTGNTAGQCSAAVSFNVAATDNCTVASVVCTPASGSTFPVGTSSVNCTATDASGNTASCGFTVTVNDTQAPQIVCPPTQNSSPGVVTYPNPTVTDNCGSATFVCSPPSGSTFPGGVSTVACTATDTAGNTASCSFTITTFDISVEGSGSLFMFNSVTGDYQFCCGGTIVNGKGKVTIKGCIVTIQQGTTETDRRVQATIDRCKGTGTATLQMPPGTIKCTITDKNIFNNPLNCNGVSLGQKKKKEKKADL